MTTQVLSPSPSSVSHNHEHEVEDTSIVAMEGDYKLIPALGASFAHSTTTRLLLMQDSAEYIPSHEQGHNLATKIPRRMCKLIKSPHKPAALAYYYVTDNGIRDWPKAVV